MKFLMIIGVIIVAALVGLSLVWFVTAGDLNFFGWEPGERAWFLFSEAGIIMVALITVEEWGWV